MVSILAIIGSLALVGGSIGYFTFPMSLSYGLTNMINLKSDGMVFPLYSDPHFPSTTTFYIYEIANPR